MASRLAKHLAVTALNTQINTDFGVLDQLDRNFIYISAKYCVCKVRKNKL